MPTLRQLQAFVLACQLGSFTRAAERMRVTQSAVTLLIKQLEAILGTALFDRTGRALRPTAAAGEILPMAERMLRQQAMLVDSVRTLAAGGSGLVSLGSTVAVAAALMPRVVAAFRARYPDVTVVMEDLSPRQLVTKVLDEEVEVAIGTQDGDEPELALMPLRRAAVCLVSRRDAAAEAGPLSWRAALELKLIAVRKGSGLRALIDASLASHDMHLAPAYEASLVTTALAMTAEGLGPTLLPPFLVPRAPMPDFVTRKLTHPTIWRELSIMTKRGRSLSPAARRLIAVTRETVGEPAISLPPSRG